MRIKKGNVSARIPLTLKELIKDFGYTQKDAYMIGAGVIVIDKAEEVTAMIKSDPNYEKRNRLKKRELIKKEKERLEKELEKDL